MPGRVCLYLSHSLAPLSLFISPSLLKATRQCSDLCNNATCCRCLSLSPFSLSIEINFIVSMQQVCVCVYVVLCVTVAMKTNDKHPSATWGGKRTTDSEHGIQHETTRAKVKPTTTTEAIKATTFCCNKSLAEHETILYILYIYIHCYI